jgi:hypothetical protein
VEEMMMPETSITFLHRVLLLQEMSGTKEVIEGRKVKKANDRNKILSFNLFN